MNRNFAALEDRVFDVLIIGGGIFGACAAWDASLRGLSVALVERNDFAAGVSANSYKFVHGGIRYLQHGDLFRLRRSCHERSALLRIAPHLVNPVPVVIPTYKGFRQGKSLLGAGMLVYDALTLDRNMGIPDVRQRIPVTRFIDAAEVGRLFPGVNKEGLTGAAVFCDGQMYNPTRLVLAFVQSAVENGTVAVNHAAAEKLLLSDSSVEAVRVRDRISGDVAEVRGRTVLNAAGPWAPWLMAGPEGRPAASESFSRDACFLVKRRFSHDHAIALQGRSRDPDALVSRPARHVFLTPWRGYTLCGVWHRVWSGHPDDVRVGREELQAFIDEVNAAMPDLNLRYSDVTMYNAGLVPFGENEEGAADLRYGKRSRVIDHAAADGLDNLVSLVGIRYTMARADAASAVRMLCAKLGGHYGRAPTDRLPVHGGDFERFDALVTAVARALGESGDSSAARALAHNYGTAFRRVLEVGRGAGVGEGCLTGTTTLRAEIVHAVREEMALRLSDVVFRRTDLCTGGHPGPAALQEAAAIAADELGWDDYRRREEIAEVERRFLAGEKLGEARPRSGFDRDEAFAGASA